MTPITNNNHPKTFIMLAPLYKRKRIGSFLAGIQLSILLMFFLVVISSCQKDLDTSIPAQEPFAEAMVAQGQGENAMTVTTMTFTATAMISSCWYENIRFTGIIENRVKTTTNASGGNHYIRQFTVKGMTAMGVNASGTPTGTNYIVQGGAEMFSVKEAVFAANGTLNLPASLTESDIVIHRGTLVFVNTETGERVVARHDIQKVPSSGILQNRWICGGN